VELSDERQFLHWCNAIECHVRALVKSVIRSRGKVPEVPEVLKAAQTVGMRRLRQDAIDKVLGGVIDLASARALSS
jgi:Tfp pilus assembly pilus retraction ATPase PilT